MGLNIFCHFFQLFTNPKVFRCARVWIFVTFGSVTVQFSTKNGHFGPKIAKFSFQGIPVGEVGGEVVESNDNQFKAGDKVIGQLGWQEFATLPGKELQVLPNDKMLSLYLGPLGAQGLTAYFGLLRIGKPEAGDTVMVSGAAGAVGSVVGQIAKINGCRVIGSAGGAEKARWLNEIGFDGSIDYKSEKVKEIMEKRR